MDMGLSMHPNKSLKEKIKLTNNSLDWLMALIWSIREGGTWIIGMDLAKLTLGMGYGLVILRPISQMAMERGSLLMAKGKLGYGRTAISRIIEELITNLY